MLPRFRARGSGVIVNYSSACGFIGYPGRSLYCASKFALEGATEAMAKEVACFGIRVFMVLPGAFRTRFADTCLLPARVKADGDDGAAVVSEPYRDTPAEKIVNYTLNMPVQGNLKGDPVKAAKRVLETVTCTGMAAGIEQTVPFRLFLGPDCARVSAERLNALRTNFDAVEAMAKSTNLDGL